MLKGELKKEVPIVVTIEDLNSNNETARKKLNLLGNCLYQTTFCLLLEFVNASLCMLVFTIVFIN